MKSGVHMTQRVQSVERALSLLEAVASSEYPLTVPELAARAGVNRATAWRLMNTLEHFDLVAKDGRSGRYSVGVGTLRIAAAADIGGWAQLVRSELEEVSEVTGGNAFLEINSRGELLVIDECRAPSLIQIDIAGMKVPHHCASVGKLYLASLPESLLEDYLKQPLTPESSESITDPQILRKEIDQARESGIAINYREHRLEWSGISAAIKNEQGRDLAYVNATVSSHYVSREDLLGFAPFMTSIARRMSDRLIQNNK
jgi:DNA-binding IclR family transcriptional regulator